MTLQNVSKVWLDHAPYYYFDVFRYHCFEHMYLCYLVIILFVIKYTLISQALKQKYIHIYCTAYILHNVSFPVVVDKYNLLNICIVLPLTKIHMYIYMVYICTWMYMYIYIDVWTYVFAYPVDIYINMYLLVHPFDRLKQIRTWRNVI